MKIPDKYYITETMGIGLRIKKAWEDIAMSLMLEHGVFIDVAAVYKDDSDRVAEFVFEIDEHKFKSLTELKKALENKAFL